MNKQKTTTNSLPVVKQTGEVPKVDASSPSEHGRSTVSHHQQNIKPQNTLGPMSIRDLKRQQIKMTQAKQEARNTKTKKVYNGLQKEIKKENEKIQKEN